MAPGPQECPSYGAYQRHIKAREEPCDGCKQARRDYDGGYRKLRTRRATDRRKAVIRATRRARAALADRYPEAYTALLEQELAKEGITP